LVIDKWCFVDCLLLRIFGEGGCLVVSSRWLKNWLGGEYILEFSIDRFGGVFQQSENFFWVGEDEVVMALDVGGFALGVGVDKEVGILSSKDFEDLFVGLEDEDLVSGEGLVRNLGEKSGLMCGGV